MMGPSRSDGAAGRGGDPQPALETEGQLSQQTEVCASQLTLRFNLVHAWVAPPDLALGID